MPLSPKSVFSLKIGWICWELFGNAFTIKGSQQKFFKRLGRLRFREKIKKMVRSRYQKGIDAVMNFAGWSSILVLVWIVILFGAAFELFSNDTELGSAFLGSLGVMGFLSFLWLFWLMFRATVGVMGHFRDKHVYQKNLLKQQRHPASLWQVLSLLTSFSLRWTTTIGLWVIGPLGFLGFAYIGIGSIFFF